MKLWISKNSEVPVREQIATQITLAIASGELAVGDRLPSRADLARRFAIHTNTVSAAYRTLSDDGWIEFRMGSGFYVRSVPAVPAGDELDVLINGFLSSARDAGYGVFEIEARLREAILRRPRGNVVLVEDDIGFRDILLAELREAVAVPVRGIAFAEFCARSPGEDSILTAMFDERPKINPLLEPPRECLYLNARSAADAMKGQRRPDAEDLVAVVSGWDKFLWLARVMLTAAGVPTESLIVRSTRDNGWRKGIDSASIVICDALAASSLEIDDRFRVFRLIADESLAALTTAVSNRGRGD